MTKHIRNILRMREGLEITDNSKDYLFENLSDNEIFEMVLEWEGLIGMSYRIKSIIKEIYNIEF